MSWTDYRLKIPTHTYQNLKRIAAQERTTIADLLYRTTRLFLFLHPVKQDPHARLLLENAGDIREIVLDLI